MRLNRPVLPISEDILAAFVASLAKEGVSYASLKVYLAAIWHYQIENSQGDPGISWMVHLDYIMKGIRRDGALKSNPRKERQPITPALLSRLFSVWERRSNIRNSKMLWAASCLAFFAFLRVGEFTTPGVTQFEEKVHLSVSDISVDRLDAPTITMVFITLKQSKTDQLRKSITIVLGRTNKTPLCPVSALLSYLVVRGMAPGSPLCVARWSVPDESSLCEGSQASMHWSSWEQMHPTSMDTASGLEQRPQQQLMVWYGGQCDIDPG